MTVPTTSCVIVPYGTAVCVIVSKTSSRAHNGCALLEFFPPPPLPSRHPSPSFPVPPSLPPLLPPSLPPPLPPSLRDLPSRHIAAWCPSALLAHGAATRRRGAVQRLPFTLELALLAFLQQPKAALMLISLHLWGGRRGSCWLGAFGKAGWEIVKDEGEVVNAQKGSGDDTPTHIHTQAHIHTHTA